MVMPRLFSMGSVSRNASPWSTRPQVRRTPAFCRRLSDNVVLPASTCARMPMVVFRILQFLQQKYQRFQMDRCDRQNCLALISENSILRLSAAAWHPSRASFGMPRCSGCQTGTDIIFQYLFGPHPEFVLQILDAAGQRRFTKGGTNGAV